MSESLDPHMLLRRTSSVLETELDGEIVMMSMEAGHCYGLDAIGSEIWRLLMKPSTLEQVQSHCRTSYAGDSASIDADVASLLSQLLSAHLIEPAVQPSYI